MSGKPYTHTVYIGGYTPVLHKKKGNNVGSSVRGVECHSCVKESDVTKCQIHGEFSAFRIGDQVTSRFGSEKGSVCWISDCKTHVKVHTRGSVVEKSVSTGNYSNSDVIADCNGSYKYRKDIACKLRSEGKQIEHAWKWCAIGPDISVKTTLIRSQQIAKEDYQRQNPPKYTVSSASTLQHQGNVGEGNQLNVYTAVNKYEVDKHAAGGSIYRTQGVKRVTTIRDNGDILTHGTPRYQQGTLSSRGKESSSNNNNNSNNSNRFDIAAYSQKSSSSAIPTNSGTSTQRNSGSETSRDTSRQSARPMVDNGR